MRITRNDSDDGSRIYRAVVQHFSPRCRQSIRFGGSVVLRFLDAHVNVATPLKGIAHFTDGMKQLSAFADRIISISEFVMSVGLDSAAMDEISPGELARRRCQVLGVTENPRGIIVVAFAPWVD